MAFLNFAFVPGFPEAFPMAFRTIPSHLVQCAPIFWATARPVRRRLAATFGIESR